MAGLLLVPICPCLGDGLGRLVLFALGITKVQKELQKQIESARIFLFRRQM